MRRTQGEKASLQYPNDQTLLVGARNFADGPLSGLMQHGIMLKREGLAILAGFIPMTV